MHSMHLTFLELGSNFTLIRAFLGISQLPKILSLQLFGKPCDNTCTQFLKNTQVGLYLGRREIVVKHGKVPKDFDMSLCQKYIIHAYIHTALSTNRYIYTLMDTFTYRISIRTYFYTYIHTPNYTDIHKHICHKHYRYSHFHSIINKKI